MHPDIHCNIIHGGQNITSEDSVEEGDFIKRIEK